MIAQEHTQPHATSRIMTAGMVIGTLRTEMSWLLSDIIYEDASAKRTGGYKPTEYGGKKV